MDKPRSYEWGIVKTKCGDGLRLRESRKVAVDNRNTDPATIACDSMRLHDFPQFTRKIIRTHTVRNQGPGVVRIPK